MDEFIGIVKTFAGNFAPRGWAFCNGQLLSINQFSALFAILGTTYGGNGVTTFALPNLQGRVPIGAGADYSTGQVGGSATATILTTNLPAHIHGIPGTTAKGTLAAPTTTSVLATSDQRNQQYAPAATAPAIAINSNPAGNNMPLSILPPYLALNFIICLEGVFPSRN